MKNNQKGFGAVEGLLIVIILALLGVVGYMVYKNHHKTVASVATSQSTPSKPSAPPQPANPYAGWKTYTLKYEKLTFNYPSQWTVQDLTGGQGLTTNADSVILTASDGYQVSIDDGWDGGGDPLNLATDSPVPVTFLGNSAYLVFSHVKCFGPDTCDSNALKGAILMLKSSSQYGPNNTAGYFPQDKNAHGDPSVNSGGSTMLINGGYTGTNAKSFATVSQAQSDPDFKNFVLVIQSMHY